MKILNPPSPTPKTIEHPKSTYQPTKAELEADAHINAPFEEVALGMVEPVKVLWIGKPRNRR